MKLAWGAELGVFGGGELDDAVAGPVDKELSGQLGNAPMIQQGAGENESGESCDRGCVETPAHLRLKPSCSSPQI